MPRVLTSLTAFALAFAASPAPAEIPQDIADEAAGLRTVALAESDAYRIVHSLTTEVGPRLAGSEATYVTGASLSIDGGFTA